MRGTGPAGALDGYLKPPKNGTFMKLFLGGAVELASQRQENRLKVKEEYYAFRDRSTLTYVAWPLALLYLNTQRKARIEAGMTHTGLTLVTVFPVLVQCYWVWMLYFTPRWRCAKTCSAPTGRASEYLGSTTTTTRWACASWCSRWTCRATRA